MTLQTIAFFEWFMLLLTGECFVVLMAIKAKLLSWLFNQVRLIARMRIVTCRAVSCIQRSVTREWLCLRENRLVIMALLANLFLGLI